MDYHDSIRRRIFVLLGVATAFAIANAIVYWRRTAPCCDWPYTTGIPFAFLEDGGLGGIRRLLWGGVAGDIAAMVGVALITDRIAARSSTRRLIASAKHTLVRAVATESRFPLRQVAIGFAIIAMACLIAFFTKQ